MACGTPLEEEHIDGRDRLACPRCGHVHWRNAKPCAGALVIRNGKVLLIRRAIEPYMGYWDIPGGFCEADEHPSQTALREVREEAGLGIELTGMLGLWLDKYDDRTTLNVYYLARPLTRSTRVGSDAMGAAWFSPRALPERIAFVNGRRALETWASCDSTPVHLRGASSRTGERPKPEPDSGGRLRQNKQGPASAIPAPS